jgi:hypothetical protein
VGLKALESLDLENTKVTDGKVAALKLGSLISEG